MPDDDVKLNDDMPVVKSRRTNIHISGYASDEAGMEKAGMRADADMLIYFRKSELIKRKELYLTPNGASMTDQTIGIELIKIILDSRMG